MCHYRRTHLPIDMLIRTRLSGEPVRVLAIDVACVQMREVKDGLKEENPCCFDQSKLENLPCHPV